MTPYDIVDRICAAYAAGAIGDAMGAPVEGWASGPIRDLLATWDWSQVIPPQGWDGTSHFWKGDGRITDDTLMGESLMRAYAAAGDHLDAYGWERHLLSDLMATEVWVPEYQQTMAVFERLWIPEKYPRWRLYGNADPRTAGVGNLVNCGVAMYAWPVGAVNAGDPYAAYQEAAALAQAHNESFAVEAAAVMAAACAAAFIEGARITDVIAVAADLAQDGTGRAIRAVVAASDPAQPLHDALDAMRAAVSPFDQRTGCSEEDHPLWINGPSDFGRPSRLASIEELPVALGVLRWGDGDFRRTLQAGVVYGRDCDSIAGMAMSLWGAMSGTAAICPSLLAEVGRGSRRDLLAIGQAFAVTCQALHSKDAERWQQRAGLWVSRIAVRESLVSVSGSQTGTGV